MTGPSAPVCTTGKLASELVSELGILVSYAIAASWPGPVKDWFGSLGDPPMSRSSPLLAALAAPVVGVQLGL